MHYTFLVLVVLCALSVVSSQQVSRSSLRAQQTQSAPSNVAAFRASYSAGQIEEVKAPKKKKKKKKKKNKKKKNKKAKDSHYTFNPTVFRSYNLVIKPRDLDVLDADPAAETYVPCAVVTDFGKANAELLQGAGCRYKGSVGSLRYCLDPITGMKNDNCRKLSWKVDSNKFLPEENKQKIMGQKKLNFNGLAVDDSLMSERLSYDMIAQAKIAGPMAVHAKLYINKEFFGIFSLVEQPDDIFTERNWKDDVNGGEGALYKDALLRTSNVNYYKAHRKTGKDEDKFMSQVALAARKATKTTAVQFFEKYFDAESIVNVTAMNSILGMTDDWRRRHNFFWYVRETSVGPKIKGVKQQTVKKLVMIPWDYDRLNDPNAKSRAPAGSPAHWYDHINPKSFYCRKKDKSPQESAAMHPKTEYDYWVEFYDAMPPDLQKPIQCDHFTKLMSAALRKRVKARIADFARDVVTEDAIKEKLISYMGQIESKVGLADDDLDKPTWKAGVRSLKKYVTQARGDALAGKSSDVESVGSSQQASGLVSGRTGEFLGFTAINGGKTSTHSSSFTPINGGAMQHSNFQPTQHSFGQPSIAFRSNFGR